MADYTYSANANRRSDGRWDVTQGSAHQTLSGDFLAGGADIQARAQVYVFENGNAALRLRASDDSLFGSAGPELSDGAEAGILIRLTDSDGTSVDIVGTGSDGSEPYQWTPGNSTEVAAFASQLAASESVTVLLRYTPPVAHAVDGGDATFNFSIPEATVTHTPGGTQSLFDAAAQNPGSDGDKGVRWNQAYTVFATTPNATRAHLVANNQMAGGVTPPTFQDQDGNTERIDWFVLHHGNDFVILNLGDDLSSDSEEDYRVAFRERGGSGLWDYAVSSDANDQDPYEMPATQADLDAIVAVITGGGTLDAIIYDASVAGALPGWDAAALTYQETDAHAVDGGDAAFEFAIPEPTVTHVPRPAMQHAVNGGDATFHFGIAEATVTHTTATPTTVAVDLGADQNVNGDTDYTLPGAGAVTVENAVGETTYLWERTGGVDVISIDDNTLLSPTVHIPDVAVESMSTWRLTATNNGVSASDTIVLTFVPVPRPPMFADDTADPQEWEAGQTVVFHVPGAGGNPGSTLAVVGDLPQGLEFFSPTLQGRLAEGVSGSGAIVIRATNPSGTDDYTIPYTITADHEVDGGDATFHFQITQPTVGTARAHAVDGGDATFEFAIPQPTVTRRVAGGVDAGDITWMVQITQPTVKRRAAITSLLPPGKTPLEVALEGAAAPRVSPDAIRDLWDPLRCPEPLLPWLAWALSVDIWEDDWTEEEKRRVIAASIEVHRHKGTVSAMRRVVEALGFTFGILEWWETTPAGTPGTAQVFLGRPAAPVFDAAEIARLTALLDEAKRATLHVTLSQSLAFDPTLYAYARYDVWDQQFAPLDTV